MICILNQISRWFWCALGVSDGWEGSWMETREWDGVGNGGQWDLLSLFTAASALLWLAFLLGKSEWRWVSLPRDLNEMWHRILYGKSPFSLAVCRRENGLYQKYALSFFSVSQTLQGLGKRKLMQLLGRWLSTQYIIQYIILLLSQYDCELSQVISSQREKYASTELILMHLSIYKWTIKS